MLPQVSEYLYSPNSPILVTLVHVSVPGADCGRITLVFYRKRAYKTECVRRQCCGALSIKALEGSRLRLRWTRSREFNRFGPGSHCKEGSCAKIFVIDVRQCTALAFTPVMVRHDSFSFKRKYAYTYTRQRPPRKRLRSDGQIGS